MSEQALTANAALMSGEQGFDVIIVCTNTEKMAQVNPRLFISFNSPICCIPVRAYPVLHHCSVFVNRTAVIS